MSITISVALMALAVFLTWWSSRRKNILLALAAGILWFSLGMAFFFSAVPVIGLSESWKSIIAYVFLVLTFIPFLFQMDTEIRHEAEGHSWSTYGEEPKTTKKSEYEDYREKLFNRTGRRSRR
jgi:predicted membrane channel-forming protein YqfA (hemolysin III family)